VSITLDQANSANGSDSNPNNSQSQQNGNGTSPLGPSPGTAVAMIILYSITGIITALFLVIIITGAIRAHRHPERYGPRNIIGRPRQSRARGIARAMLETIPIVKFGDREDPKPADVELAAGTNQNAQTDRRASQTEARDVAQSESAEAGEAQPRASLAEGGIAAATSTPNGHAHSDPDNQGCSICTEDFEIGQDQRVLPCDHRFHPECIDPWLLNVSGTCPLCRIDLRPQTSGNSVDGEVDEDGNPIHRTTSAEGGEGPLPPPLGQEGRDRRSVRRSVLASFRNMTRPEQMTREERVQALRNYRAQHAADGARGQRESRTADASTSAAVGGGDAPAENDAEAQDDDTRMRTRLRNAFRVRTRRTGQDDAPAAPSTENTPPEPTGGPAQVDEQASRHQDAAEGSERR
jgi:hypothetical protein